MITCACFEDSSPRGSQGLRREHSGRGNSNFDPHVCRKSGSISGAAPPTLSQAQESQLTWRKSLLSAPEVHELLPAALGFASRFRRSSRHCASSPGAQVDCPCFHDMQLPGSLRHGDGPSRYIQCSPSLTVIHCPGGPALHSFREPLMETSQWQYKVLW